MKKIIALLLTLALCASCVVILASCGEAGESAYQIAVRTASQATKRHGSSPSRAQRALTVQKAQRAKTVKTATTALTVQTVSPHTSSQ